MKAAILAGLVAAAPIARAPTPAAPIAALAVARPASPAPAIAPPGAPAPQIAGAGKQAGAAPIVGAWRLTQVGGKVDCTLILTDHPGAAGRDIEAPIACQRAFPPLKDLTAWTAGARGAPVFTGPKVKHAVAFAGPAGGPYTASAPDGRAWRLTWAPAKPAAETAH